MNSEGQILLTILTLSMMAGALEPADSFPPALDSVAWAYIDTAMLISGTSRLDAEFEKKWATDTLFRLPIVTRILDHPLELPETLDSWTKFLLEKKNEPTRIAWWLYELLDTNIDVKARKKITRKIDAGTKSIRFPDVPKTYETALAYIISSFDVAAEYREKALSEMPEKSIDSLLLLLPTFWTDDEDTLADTLQCYYLKLLGHECDTSLEVHLDSLYELMHNFKMQEFAKASFAVFYGAQKALKILLADTSLPKLDRPVYITTKWGNVVLGTKNTDILGNATVIIDPGGSDFYTGEFAGGVLGKTPFSVVIDISGNDRYDSRGDIVAQGAGVFGVGVLLDYQGDDVYLASHYSQGAGLFGAGLLVDYAGDDQYSGGVFVQGAGNFGIGAIIDLSGDDKYNAYAYAQAFSGPKGAGLIADYDGSDLYYCGAKYSHKPLVPLDYHSFAQGFSIGWRPDVSGGIGLLFDKKGNDTYTAGVYSQGSSYWYSMGAIIDNDGNDVHTSVYYPQGSGIHLSIGALVDRGGDDIYVSRYGPGQGSAHDYSVAFFSDYRGDDIYVIDGGNGNAITNSFALFVDRNGDDLYAKRFPRSDNFGKAKPARGTGSFGLFLDLEGPDQYSENSPARNDAYWFQGDVGVGLDIPGEPFPNPIKELAEKEAEEEEKDTIRTIEEIFNDACAWAVGSAQLKAKKAFQELLDSAEAAAKYICEHQLGTKSSLRLRTIKNFCKKKPELMRPCLFKALHDENRRRRGNAIYLFGEMHDTLAVDSLIALLGDKKTRLSAISALGKIKDTSATLPIMKWRDEKRQAGRYIVAKALAEIGDPRALPVLIDFLDDDYLVVRLAAQYGLVKMYKNSFDTLIKILPNSDLPKKLHIIRALSSICKKMRQDSSLTNYIVDTKIAAVKKALLPLLDSDDRSVRSYAIRALASIGGEATMKLMQQKYELETDPYVRSIYRRALEQIGTIEK